MLQQFTYNQPRNIDKTFKTMQLRSGTQLSSTHTIHSKFSKTFTTLLNDMLKHMKAADDAQNTNDYEPEWLNSVFSTRKFVHFLHKNNDKIRELYTISDDDSRDVFDDVYVLLADDIAKSYRNDMKDMIEHPSIINPGMEAAGVMMFDVLQTIRKLNFSKYA